MSKSKKRFQDYIQIQLEKKATNLYKEIDKKGVLMLHFLSGTIKDPFTLRRTAIRANQATRLGRFANGNSIKKADEINKLHRDALANCIKHFLRDNTFLRYLLKLYDKHIQNCSDDPSYCYNEEMTVVISINGEDLKIIEDFDSTNKIVTCKVGRQVIEKLGLGKNSHADIFLYSLYTDNWGVIGESEWSDYFHCCINELFGKTLDDNEINKWKKEDKEIFHKINGNDKTYNFDFKKERKLLGDIYHKCNAYHAGLLYFWYASSEPKTEIDKIRIKLLPFKERQSVSILVSIVSSDKDYELSLHSKTNLYKKCIIKDKKGGELEIDNIEKALNSLIFRELTNLDDKVYKSDDKSPVEGFIDVANDVIFNGMLKSNYYEIFLKYLICLSYRLKDAKHENNKLGFYFICGDTSEFNDFESTKLRLLGRDELKPLQIKCPYERNKEEENTIFLDKLIKNAAKALSKEHFPWFENGRNGLIWDINSTIEPGKIYPVGLASINLLTWKQYLNNPFSEMSKIKIPNCVVFEVSDDLPIIRIWGIDGNNIRECLRFQNGKWIKLSDTDRVDALVKIFTNHCEYSEDMLGENSDIYEVLDLAVKISADPHRGGTIVLLEENYTGRGLENIFGEIGYPWNPENILQEDRISLISHDGATVVKRANNDKFDLIWKHRLFLLSGGLKPNKVEKLFKYFGNSTNECYENGEKDLSPLSFVGTRRWSAAITAFHPLVNTVIVMSQDGDITIWHVKNKEREEFHEEDIIAIQYPLAGTPEKYDFAGNIYKKISALSGGKK